MRTIVFLAAAIIAILAVGALVILGTFAVAISNEAEEMRWNDNDDRKGKKHDRKN
nr:MAG TPA: hypothetical protein [Caudoviricetes sp.]